MKTLFQLWSLRKKVADMQEALTTVAPCLEQDWSTSLQGVALCLGKLGLRAVSEEAYTSVVHSLVSEHLTQVPRERKKQGFYIF